MALFVPSSRDCVWMFLARLVASLVVVMATLGAFARTPLRADPADMLLLNGRIVTLDGVSSIKQALAI